MKIPRYQKPIEARSKQKILLVMLILIGFLCINLVSALEWWGEKEIFWETGEDSNFNVGATAHSQTFNATNNFSLIGISIKGHIAGSPTILLIHLCDTNLSGAPNCSTIYSQNISIDVSGGDPWNSTDLWHNITMPVYDIIKGKVYAIVANLTLGNGDAVVWRGEGAGSYPNGTGKWDSNDNGTTWTTGADKDFIFQVWSKRSIINLISPTDNKSLSLLGTNLTTNFTANYSLLNYNLTNATYYVWDSTGNIFNNSIIVYITGTSNSTSEYIDNFVSGDYEWNILACYRNATFSDCSFSYANYSFSVDDWAEVSQTYNKEVVEGNIENFNISIGYNSIKFTNIEARLIYNETSYLGTKIGTGFDVVFTKDITIPNVATDTNLTFYWEINLINNTNNYYNSSLNNQTIKNLFIDDCTTYTTLILNASIYDEETQDMLNSSDNTIIEIDIDIFSEGGTTPIIEYSQNYTNMSSATVCIGDDLSNSTYQMDAQIFYKADDYAEEFYHIQNLTLTNSSIPQNINLYDLKDTNAQSFKITYKNSNFLAVENALIQIQRKYINEGVFKIVEIPKTDSNGETLASLQLEEAIYTLVIVKNGVNLATFSNIMAICQNPALETCEINLNNFGSAISPKDYTVGDDFIFTLTYNKLTREIETIFSIPSGGASEVILNATLFDNLGGTEACSESITSAGGTLNCIVPINLGNGTVITKITKAGELMGQAFISLKQKPKDLYGANIVFLGLILTLTLVGIGITDTPMITGFFFLLGAILLIALNLVDTGVSSFIGAGATVLWLFIAIIVVLIKGSKRT